MVEFSDEDLTGSAFRNVNLSGALFHEVELSDARVHGGWGTRLVLDGAFDELVYNDVDLIPLWNAEMARRHPEFGLLRPDTADGYREVWPRLEALWVATLARARALPEEFLHEQVNDEWSFIETLRHLLFVHDAWLRRAVLHEQSPYDDLDLAHTEMLDLVGVPHDGAARPSLAHLVELREARLAIARRFFAELGDTTLAADTVVTGPGYPEPGTYAVQRCLRAVVNEEWWHHRFAVRDLAVLESRG